MTQEEIMNYVIEDATKEIRWLDREGGRRCEFEEIYGDLNQGYEFSHRTGKFTVKFLTNEVFEIEFAKILSTHQKAVTKTYTLPKTFTKRFLRYCPSMDIVNYYLLDLK